MRCINYLFQFMWDIFHARHLLLELTKKDLRQRYIGSCLGLLWAVIQPILTVLILWFVFQVGFKAMPVNNFPFILWLLCGMFPWFLFSEAWQGATNSIWANAFLVKKVAFRVSLLPIIQILSALVIGLFFHMLLFGAFIFYGYPLCIYQLQLIYYLFSLICLVFGLSLITSALVVFLKDVGQFVGLSLHLGFWVTPIFWNLDMIPVDYRWLFQLNPMCYIVTGYRSSFIDHEWFWNLGYTTASFWLITGGVLLLGAYLFRRLRPHFADVL